MRFRVTAANGNTLTINNPSNASDGQVLIIEVLQDSTGGGLIAFGNKFAYGLAVPFITLSTGANKHDLIAVYYQAALDKFLIMAFTPGFN